MPFRSEAQRRFMWAKHPELAKEWEEHTPKKNNGKDYANLPERVRHRKKKKK